MTVAEAQKAIREICAAQLYGAGFVAMLGPEKVAAACNGCGPASWPEERRRKLDKWLATFAPAFDVHDCRFEFDNDGSREKFDAANEELRKNCLLLADQKYAWYNPLRYFARHAAHLIYRACDMFGWDAWTDAHKRNLKER